MSALDLSDNITRAHHDSMERTRLSSPYADEQREAMTRVMQRESKCAPTLSGKLAWLERAWKAESPERLHEMEVEPASALGTPKRTSAFRTYVENDPYETDSDGYFLRPLQAALARLSHGSPPRPLAARWIREVGRAGRFDSDWQRVVTQRGWTLEEGEVYLNTILGLLWDLYRPDVRRR